MLDRVAIRWLKPLLVGVAARLQQWQVHADTVTLVGFAIGMAGALAIACNAPLTGLALLLASRVCDGLDGALARLTMPTDAGAFLDITLA